MKTMKKTVILMLVITLLPFVSIPAQGQVTPLNMLAEAESIVYGQPLDLPLVERIEKLENSLFNETKEGSLQERINRILNFVLSAEDKPSLLFLVSALEWSLSNSVYRGSIIPRIDELEVKVFGEFQEGSLVERMERLAELVFPADGYGAAQVVVPEGKSIQIRLVDEIDTRRAELGKIIKYEVVNDIKIDDKLVIPAGAVGMLEVVEIKEAGQFGRDGDVKLKASSLTSIDGTPVKVEFITETDDDTLSREKAVGAGLLGTMIISHPIGLIASFFIKGENIVIPAGSEFNVAVAENTTVYGLKLK